jgi:hypothetical protein
MRRRDLITQVAGAALALIVGICGRVDGRRRRIHGKTTLTEEIMNSLIRGTELRRKSERCPRCCGELIYSVLKRRGWVYVRCEDCEFLVTEPIRFIQARLEAEALRDAIRHPA